MCYKQKCKVVSLNLAHPVQYAVARPSVRLSVRLTVTRSDQSKTVEVNLGL